MDRIPQSARDAITVQPLRNRGQWHFDDGGYTYCVDAEPTVYLVYRRRHPLSRRIRRAARRYVAISINWTLQGVAFLSFFAVVIVVAYYIAGPFYEFADWVEDNNIVPRFALWVFMPMGAAIASQMKINLSEQAKRREPKNIKRAWNQVFDKADGQVDELLLLYVAWMAFAVGAVALTGIVERI